MKRACLLVVEILGFEHALRYITLNKHLTDNGTTVEGCAPADPSWLEVESYQVGCIDPPAKPGHEHVDKYCFCDEDWCNYDEERAG